MAGVTISPSTTLNRLEAIENSPEAHASGLGERLL
jgi:hypothetical protein